MEKLVNQGKVLSASIKEMGLKKKRVAEMLRITPPTLNKRLKDGEFFPWQIEILKKHNLI